MPNAVNVGRYYVGNSNEEGGLDAGKVVALTGGLGRNDGVIITHLPESWLPQHQQEYEDLNPPVIDSSEELRIGISGQVGRFCLKTVN